MDGRISLLHATYRRPSSPVEVKEAWLERADDAASVEHVFAMDADDEETVAATEGHLRVVGPAGAGMVTSVRNWNAAAALATGDLLMVIADDLFPPPGWDTMLRSVVGGADPLRVSFAVKVVDSEKRTDCLLRHPIVSRAYYRRYGLFSDAYRGVYCDNDITVRAFWRGVIIDGRGLVLEHRHPSVDVGASASESYRRVNAQAEYDAGRGIYEASWSARCRAARIRLVPVPRRRRSARVELEVRRLRNNAAGTADYWQRRFDALVRRCRTSSRGGASR